MGINPLTIDVAELQQLAADVRNRHSYPAAPDGVHRLAAGVGHLVDENARLRTELDRLNAGRQEIAADLAETQSALRYVRGIAESRDRMLTAVCTVADRAHLMQDGGNWPDCPGCLIRDAVHGGRDGRLPLPVAELDAWCEYWRREADADRARATELEQEAAAALQVLDLVLVDPDAPEDTGEPDDAGELVDAAETAATRLRLAEAEVVRLATEVERLSAGEMSLPGAPALTGGAR